MPTPKNKETREEFLPRCMASPEQKKSFPNPEQRFAVCVSIWKQNLKKK